jgi:hypothetical protein
MKDQILDEGYWAKNEIKSKKDLAEVLRKAGYHSFYEHKNGSIIVEQGEAVRVEIQLENNSVNITPRFPKIGNSMQIAISAVLLAIFLFIIPVPFPLQWVIAILGGQAASYLIHSPKTRNLKEKIESIIV